MIAIMWDLSAMRTGAVAAGLLGAVLLNGAWAQEKAPTDLQQCTQQVKLLTDRLGEAYRQDLGGLRDSFQKDGDLEGYVAVEEELKRFEQNPALNLETLAASPAALVELQQKHASKMNQEVTDLVKSFCDQYERKIRILTQQGSIAEAKKLHAEMKSFKNSYQKQFTQLEAELEQLQANALAVEVVCQAYRRNPALADSMLKNRELSLAGVVQNIEYGFGRSSFYIITLASKEHSGERVRCEISKPEWLMQITQPGETATAVLRERGESTRPVMALKCGQPLELKGKFSGQQMALTLEVGEIPASYWPPEAPTQANAQQTA